jgi:hypothetical protein
LILRKAILIACGVAALAAAAAVGVFALAFALYAALLPAWGPALAAAGVAAACALLILLGALSAFVAANPPRLKKKAGSEDLVAKAFVLAREKPIIAAAAILAAGAVALKNPKVTAALIAAFMAKPPAKK